VHWGEQQMSSPSDHPEPAARPSDPSPAGEPARPVDQPGSYGQPAYGQPAYGQPGYGPPAYGQYGPQPGAGPAGSGPGYGPPGAGHPGYPAYRPPGGGPYGEAPQPGVIPLRPLGVGDILPGAVRFIRSNPVLTLGLAALVALCGQALQLIANIVVSQPDPADLAEGGLDGLIGSFLAQLVAGVVGIVPSAILAGMLFVALSRAVLGQRIDVGAAWRSVAPRLPGLIGLARLIGLIVGGIFTVPMVLMVAFAQSGNIGGALLGVGLFFAAMVLVVYLAVLWIMAPVAYVLETVGVVAALTRSRGLVRGAWWQTFGVLMLAFLVVFVPALVLFVPLTISAALAPGTGMLVASAIATVVLSTFATPFTTGVVGLLYIDQRIRRERFDVELARSAGPPQAG
jgi:hypothetical protein